MHAREFGLPHGNVTRWCLLSQDGVIIEIVTVVALRGYVAENIVAVAFVERDRLKVVSNGIENIGVIVILTRLAIS